MKMLIDGHWVDRKDRIDVVDPYDNSVIDTVPGATAEDVDAALAAAVRGLEITKKMTVKMRRGMDDSQQSRDDFFAIFDGAFHLGAAAITVHGRTVGQRRRRGPGGRQLGRRGAVQPGTGRSQVVVQG